MTYMDGAKNFIKSAVLVTILTLSVSHIAHAEEDAEQATLSANDKTRVEHLAQVSGKTTDEILAMRNEGKMGWGQIAKELGVHPREVGQAIKEDRHEKNVERKLAQAERKEKRMAMKEKKSKSESHKNK